MHMIGDIPLGHVQTYLFTFVSLFVKLFVSNLQKSNGISNKCIFLHEHVFHFIILEFTICLITYICKVKSRSNVLFNHAYMYKHINFPF